MTMAPSITKDANAQEDDSDLEDLIAKPAGGSKSLWTSLDVHGPAPVSLRLGTSPHFSYHRLYQRYWKMILPAIIVTSLQFSGGLNKAIRNSSLREDLSNVIEVSSNLSKYLSLVADARDAFGAQQCSGERNDSLLLAETGAAHCYPQPSSKFNPSRLNHNPSYNVTLTVSLYQTYYGNAARDVNGAWKSCRRPCLEIGVADGHDVDAAASADVVNIVMQGSHSIPWKRPANQIWVGVYFESPGHTPFQDEEIFNLTLGFRADSDFPIFGMAYDTFQNYEGLSPNALRVKDFTLPTFEAKNASDMAMMSVWISNCGIETTGRIRILNELASHGVTYASYGRCQHTHAAQEARSTLPTEWWDLPADGGAEKIAVSAKHLFLYAAENSAYPLVHH